MSETSQSVMRVVGLITFTMFFAGAWANDQPREQMAQKEMPKPTAILSKEESQPQESADIAAPEEVVSLPVPPPVELPKPLLDTVQPTRIGMTMTISVETEGLSIAEKTVQQHIQKLPLGIANGDYLMVDPLGGVGWLRIRGQAQIDRGEQFLTTQIEDATVRYMRVSPVDAAEPLRKPVPMPVQYAQEETKTVR